MRKYQVDINIGVKTIWYNQKNDIAKQVEGENMGTPFNLGLVFNRLESETLK